MYRGDDLARAQRYRTRAEECRSMAEDFAHAEVKRRLLSVAKSYEAMAARIESLRVEPK